MLRLADVHFARRRLITGRTRTVTRSQTGGVTPRRARLVQPPTRTRPAPVTVTATTILTKSLTFIRFIALTRVVSLLTSTQHTQQMALGAKTVKTVGSSLGFVETVAGGEVSETQYPQSAAPHCGR